MAKIHIGTSGFSYEHWEKGVFYPKDLAKSKQLEYYSQHFPTVELNNPFYHLPSAKVFQSWYQRTPKNFIFAVKASRYLTHIKKLKDSQEPWQRFINNAKELKEKLGVILFQLPPTWPVNIKRLKDFLKILPKKYQYVFEFRHQTWFNQEVYDLLKKHKIALCLTDTKDLLITTDFVYLRLHGPASYSNQELRNLALKIKKSQKQIKAIYVYFNNDAYGYALKNAQTLYSLLN